MSIVEGQLTFDAEGTEGGPFHSRKLCVPSASSGLTIGRGYDMKEKSRDQNRTDLINAGMAADMAEQLSRAAGLQGQAAEQFIGENDLSDFEISPDVQEKLFIATYTALSRDVQRICNKPDCVEAYGAVDWEVLNPTIKDVLIDLRFRGDYTPDTRKIIQKCVTDNDLQAFAEALCNKENWESVPRDRFDRRVSFIRAALRGSNA
jgi:hypothetical protein